MNKVVATELFITRNSKDATHLKMFPAGTYDLIIILFKKICVNTAVKYLNDQKARLIK